MDLDCAALEELLDREVPGEGSASDRVVLLTEEVQRLAARLQDLIDSRAFRLGDVIVKSAGSLLAPWRFGSREPAPTADQGGVADSLSHALQQICALPLLPRAQELLALRTRLHRHIRIVRQGVRLQAGERILACAQDPSQVGRLPMWLTGTVWSRIRKRIRPGRTAGESEYKLKRVSSGPLFKGRSASDRHVAIFGDLDTSLVDGASIWLASVTEALAQVAGVRVSVLLGSPRWSRDVFGHLLDMPGVELFEVKRPGAQDPEPLQPSQALRILAELDQQHAIDLFLLRGRGQAGSEHLNRTLLDHPKILRRSWVYLVDPGAFPPGRHRRELQEIGQSCRAILCQTPEARAAIEVWFSAEHSCRLELLPPVIRSAQEAPRRLPSQRPLRIAYAGKFSPPYRILEMLGAFERIRAQVPGAEFHVLGGKFHNHPPMPGFEEEVRRALVHPGVVYHGRHTRERTVRIVSGCDFASSWRDQSFDNSLELATKVLEYGGMGLPVLLNPTAMHRRMFGDDYPGFISNEDDFVQVTMRLVESPVDYQIASERVLAVARAYTIEGASDHLAQMLKDEPQELQR